MTNQIQVKLGRKCHPWSRRGGSDDGGRGFDFLTAQKFLQQHNANYVRQRFVFEAGWLILRRQAVSGVRLLCIRK
jgi:hypothetical protein